MPDSIVHIPGEVAKDVVTSSNELVDPVIDHAERITRVEGNLTQTEERLNNSLIDTERRLREAIDANAAQETISRLEGKVTALEAKLESMTVHPVETAESTSEEVVAAPGQAAAFVVPAIENSPAPPERERRSIRHRRKGRRK